MQKSAVIEYKHDGYLCEGYAVWDDAGAKRPGILVFPEWVGVGEYTHKRAEMLCELGYNAFVADVYGKGIRPDTPETCEVEMMKYATNRPLLRERANCAFDELRKLPNTDLGKMAAIGYCFGGMIVLEMARDGQNDLNGVVSFHGVLATPMPLKAAPITARSWCCTASTIRSCRTIRPWRSGRKCAMPRRTGSSSPTAMRCTPSPTG